MGAWHRQGAGAWHKQGRRGLVGARGTHRGGALAHRRHRRHKGCWYALGAHPGWFRRKHSCTMKEKARNHLESIQYMRHTRRRCSFSSRALRLFLVLLRNPPPPKWMPYHDIARLCRLCKTLLRKREAEQKIRHDKPPMSQFGAQYPKPTGGRETKDAAHTLHPFYWGQSSNASLSSEGET